MDKLVAFVYCPITHTFRRRATSKDLAAKNLTIVMAPENSALFVSVSDAFIEGRSEYWARLENKATGRE